MLGGRRVGGSAAKTAPRRPRQLLDRSAAHHVMPRHPTRTLTLFQTSFIAHQTFTFIPSSFDCLLEVERICGTDRNVIATSSRAKPVAGAHKRAKGCMKLAELPGNVRVICKGDSVHRTSHGLPQRSRDPPSTSPGRHTIPYRLPEKSFRCAAPTRSRRRRRRRRRRLVNFVRAELHRMGHTIRCSDESPLRSCAALLHLYVPQQNGARIRVFSRALSV